MKLQFLTDFLIGNEPSPVPAAFRRHAFVAGFINGEIVTEFIFWATLTRDPEARYWLILEAGRQHLPGHAEPSLWYVSPLDHPLIDSVEAALLAEQPEIDQRRVTWLTHEVSVVEAARWLEVKLGYITAVEDSPYVKHSLSLNRSGIRQLLSLVALERAVFPNICLVLCVHDLRTGLAIEVREDQISHSKISFGDMSPTRTRE